MSNCNVIQASRDDAIELRVAAGLSLPMIWPDKALERTEFAIAAVAAPSGRGHVVPLRKNCAMLGSNQRLLACEASALPLS